MYSLAHQHFLKYEAFLPKLSAGAGHSVFLGSSCKLCGLSSVLVCLCTAPDHDGCRCGLSRQGERVCGAPAKRRQQQAGDGSPAMTHSLLLAQEFAMKAGGGGYKLWPVPNVSSR